MQKTSATLLLLFFSALLFAQSSSPVTFQSVETAEANAGYLEELQENPININNATKEEIDAIPFLTPFQKASLWQYLSRNRPILSAYELGYIVGFSKHEAIFLANYITLFPTQKSKAGRPLLHSVYTSFCSKSNGERQWENDIENAKHQLKYSAKNNRANFGFIMEQDAEEQYLQENNYKPDYLSGYISVKHNNFQIFAGDHELRWGQGLVIWQGYSFSKPLQYTDIRKYSSPVKTHTSSEENRFSRGITVTKNFKSIAITVSASSTPRDGYLSGSIPKFTNTGLHRTENERLKHDNLLLTQYGGQTEVSLQQLKIGIRHLQQIVSTRQDSTASIHNNSSTDFTYSRNKIIMFGEYALDENRKYAHVTGLQLFPDQQISFCMLLRNYAPGYHSISGQAFSEFSGIGNENAVYIAAHWQTAPKIQCMASHDIFAAPEPKFTTPFASKGNETRVRASYTPTDEITITPRISYQIKEQEWKNNKTETLNKTVKTTYALSTHYTPGPFTFSVGGMMSESSKKEVNENGTLVYWQCKLHLAPKVTASFQNASFNTVYNTQLYLYEPSVGSGFSVPAYNGKGSKSSILIIYKTDKLKAGIKASRLKTASTSESSGRTIQEWSASLTFRF